MVNWRKIFYSVLLNRLTCQIIDFWRPPKNIGQFGERIAERHLLRSGYWIVERNYRGSRGELDLVAVDDKTVVFVEVKTRSSDQGSAAVEAVDEHKQRQIATAASEFVAFHDLKNVSKRFDVITIAWDDRRPVLRHFKDAFECGLDD